MYRPLLQFVVLICCGLIAHGLVAQQPKAPIRSGQPLPRRLPPIEELPEPERRPMLTLPELEQLALTHNPSLARSAAMIRASQGDWVQTGLYPNPTVALGEQQTGSRGVAEQDGFTVQQEFVTANKLGLNREVAAREILWNRQQWQAQRQRVLTDVRSEFFNVAIGERQREITDQLVDIAEKGVASAEERNKGDEIGRNDVIEAKIELYNAHVAAFKGVNRAKMARQRLAAAVGLPEIAAAELEGNLDHVPEERQFEETLETIRGNSPEIAAAQAEIERARWALQRAGVEKIPNVTAAGLYNWRDNGVLNGKPDGAFQFSLPLPLYNRNQGGVQRAAAELAAAQRTLRQLELNLRDRLADTFEAYANSRMQVRVYRDEVIPAAAEALELTRAAYLAGDVDYNDLLTSQRTNTNANLEYLRALKELRTSEMAIRGLLLSDSLESATKP
jgi:cobalt-zinc-cadmium efflux system outer membrane protein